MNELEKIDNLYTKISSLIQEARKSVKTAVNIAMVYTYYNIGKMIIEDEQKGNYRAEYGAKVLDSLATKLTKEFGKGFSKTNLKRFRSFYVFYSQNPIGPTALDQLENYPMTDKGKKFYLSFSHYLMLMNISNPEERNFYEVECVKNDWSLKEFERQYNSSLFERLILSKNKDEIKKLANEGQIIENPADAIKDPYVLEFLGLPELPFHTQDDKEMTILSFF